MKNFLKSKKIAFLKKYFEKEPSVVLAFLFGSYAKGFEMEESDLDLGVYLKDEEKRDKIWGEVSKIAEREVDLVCLNEAPASLISNIFKTGVPLAIKDKKLYWELYLRTSSETEDFLEFVEDYWRIYKKAKSLESEEKIRISKRLQFLDSELKDIEDFKKLTFEKYQDNKSKRREVEKWTENIINATIDIAKMILASEKKEMPKNYREALFDFALFVGFEVKESEKFAELADLRNILAHEYLDILYGKIQDFIKEFPKFYKKISKFLEKYLKHS